jgi:hypothetical protein
MRIVPVLNLLNVELESQDWTLTNVPPVGNGETASSHNRFTGHSPVHLGNDDPCVAQTTKILDHKLVKHRKCFAMTEPIWLNKHDAAKLLGMSWQTLKNLHSSGELIEGVHYVVLNSRNIRYNKTMLEDWMRHRATPTIHHIKIEEYLKAGKKAV